MGIAAKEEIQAQNKNKDRGKEHITLIFVLGEEDYGLDVNNVREILRLPPFITRVPNTSSSVMGVINLRGSIVPIFDMRLKMGIAEKNLTNDARIVVLTWNENLFGILVDAVKEVSIIYDGQIELAPQLNLSMEKKYLLGIAKRGGDRLIVLLDLSAVFDMDDILDEKRSDN